MHDHDDLASLATSRRRFLRVALTTAAAAGAAAALAACSSGGGYGDPSPSPSPGSGGASGQSGGACLTNGASAGTISNNHGHALTVPKEDVAAAVEKTYSIQGSAGHDHEVTVTAADFAKLADNDAITVTSTTTAGHTHTVTVVCA